MNPIAIVIGLFDWRGVLGRAAYRRNLSILVLVNLLVERLDLFHGPAFYLWTALCFVMGLSFDARRYHDMGWSAAWLVWTNLIFGALIVVVFQFIPNVLDRVPILSVLGVDASAGPVFGRFVLPAIIGALGGSLFQSLWLAAASSMPGVNPYAMAPLASRRAAPNEDEGPDEAALQAIIDRHMAARQNEPAATTRPSLARPAAPSPTPRQFGRRGL
jgi:uncharacterized membrane protein YhaH (DUF805 family)